MLSEETQAFQMNCSQMADQAKSQEAKETVATGNDSTMTLKELMSLEMCLPRNEIQELYRRLEQLKSQFK